MTSGTAEGWRREVAQAAVGNSRLMFAILVPLGATLLRYAEEGSGGFHFVGKSSSGKTTALHLTASVGGTSILTWRATGNGIEGQCAEHNDYALLLDETGVADPKVVAEAAYAALNGSGKLRMTIDRRPEQVLRWRLLLLSTGETSLARLMAGSGVGVHAGQATRIADHSGRCRGWARHLRDLAAGLRQCGTGRRQAAPRCGPAPRLGVAGVRWRIDGLRRSACDR